MLLTGLTKVTGLLGFALIVSCNSSDTPSDSSAVEQSTLHVVSASSSVELTRAQELTSGSIGVFQTSTLAGYFLQANKEYAYTDGSWTAVGDEVYLHAANASICGYTPYDATYTDYTAVPLTSAAYTASDDLVYSSTLDGVVNELNPNVSFTMKHAYSRITLKIRRGSYTGIGAVSSITVSGSGLYTAGTLNLSTGTYAGLTTGSPSLSPDITSTATDTDTEVGFRLVPSGELFDGLTLTFVVDGYTLKATTTTYSKLEAGVNYQASVVINGQAITPVLDTAIWEEVPYDEIIETAI